MARIVALLSGVALAVAACGGSSQPGTGANADPAASTQPAATRSPAAPSTPEPARCRAGEFGTDWRATDFTRCTVDIGEVIRGCPVRDCIPPLDAAGAVTIRAERAGEATFVPVAEAGYSPTLPVAYVEIDGTVRGYPLHILTWHEVVNDQIGAVPFAATFCPLCNTALAFDRRVGDRILDFGVSGNLRHSDLIMWDRQTESWWQQATGEAIVGTLAGEVLRPLAMTVISFQEFARSFPSANILSEETGFGRPYGDNPYVAYDTAGNRPFLFVGEMDARLDGLERVLTLAAREEILALPFSELARAQVANVEVGGQPFAVFWSPGTVSVLDRYDIVTSRDVGAAAPFAPVVDGRHLTFTAVSPGVFRDHQTGSSWSLTGFATAGPLEGRRLEAVPHTTAFWFAWAAFHPDTEIWSAGR